MKLFTAFFFSVLLLGDAQAQDEPRAVPLFSQLEKCPVFMVDCTNGSDATIDVSEFITELALRVDGVLYEHTGPFIASLMGGATELSPGKRWRVMVCLRQEPSSSSSAKFGAVLRIPRQIPLTAGSHSVEFRCQGKWSEKVEFFWETDRVAR